MVTNRTFRVAALVIVAALAAVAPGAHAASTPFTPSTLAGKWSGTWTNLTFNTSGEASIVATSPGNTRLNFTVDFGGKVFGCDDPPASSDGIPKGTGPNTWDDAGFRLEYSSEAFGSSSLVYDDVAKTLKGSGTNPTCLNGLKWTLDGTFNGESFTGSISIVLPDGTPASSKLEMTREAPSTTPTPTPVGDDTTAPILVSQGYVGSREHVPLRWRAKDAGGIATFEVTVSLPQKPGAPLPKARFTRTLKSQTVGTKQLTAHTIDWPASRTTETWFRMCVRATDKAGNKTGRVCSTLKLTS